MEMSSQHFEKEKSDINVQRFIFKNPKFDHLPDASSIKGKFKNVDNLFFDGAMIDSGSFVKLDDNSFYHYGFVHNLAFQFVKLGKMPGRLLFNLPDLVTFEVSWCGLKTVPFGFFDQNPKLRSVKLYNNVIESLPDEIFKNNNQLEVIMIHHNQIKSLPAHLIMNAPLLTEFDAEENGINSVPENFKKNNVNLIKFKI